MNRRSCIALLLVTLLFSTGCPPPVDRPIIHGPVLPMRDAVAVVNENLEQVEGTLRASGVVDGFYEDVEGRRRTFSMQATLFFCAPTCLRLNMKKIGETRLLVGSNLTGYWFDNRLTDEFVCGRFGDADERRLPIQPRKLIEALGLTRIGDSLARPGEAGRFQRVTDRYQQVLFLEESFPSGRQLSKEYWIDRAEPRLLSKVVFRDHDGRETLASDLEDYRRMEDSNVWLPHVIVARWMEPASEMRFQISKWQAFTDISCDGIQFAIPAECDR